MTIRFWLFITFTHWLSKYCLYCHYQILCNQCTILDFLIIKSSTKIKIQFFFIVFPPLFSFIIFFYMFYRWISIWIRSYCCFYYLFLVVRVWMQNWFLALQNKSPRSRHLPLPPPQRLWGRLRLLVRLLQPLQVLQILYVSQMSHPVYSLIIKMIDSLCCDSRLSEYDEFVWKVRELSDSCLSVHIMSLYDRNSEGHQQGVWRIWGNTRVYW